MSHRPARLVAALACIMGLLLLPTGLSSAQEPPPPKTTFTVGVVQDVDSLNPFIGITVAAYEMFQLVYPPLTEYGAKDFAIEPGSGGILGGVSGPYVLDLQDQART